MKTVNIRLCTAEAAQAFKKGEWFACNWDANAKLKPGLWYVARVARVTTLTQGCEVVYSDGSTDTYSAEYMASKQVIKLPLGTKASLNPLTYEQLAELTVAQPKVAKLAPTGNYDGEAKRLFEAVRTQTRHYIDWLMLHGKTAATAQKMATDCLNLRIGSLAFTLAALERTDYSTTMDKPVAGSRHVSQHCYGNAYDYVRKNPECQLAVGGWVEGSYFKDVANYDIQDSPYGWKPLEAYSTFFTPIFSGHGFAVTPDKHVVDPTLSAHQSGKYNYVWEIVNSDFQAALKGKPLSEVFALLEQYLKDRRMALKSQWAPLIKSLIAP